MEAVIETIFKESKNNYGTRKIKIELEKQEYTVSRRKISLSWSKQDLLRTILWLNLRYIRKAGMKHLSK
ncbi:IS3 family transposase [Virgibacillus byunsanensis]|uniref:IS3 family transposase n=1 Tax=Virgibacillus byunsanensis TaxID=570945 RepID=A0ABW3LRS4_9BACI